MSKIVGSDVYPYRVVRKTEKCLFVKPALVSENKMQWPEQDFEVLNVDESSKEIKLVHTVNGWTGNGMHYVEGARYYLDPSF